MIFLFQITWADIVFFCAYESFKDVQMADEIFGKSAAVTELVKKVGEDPKIKAYLAQRKQTMF